MRSLKFALAGIVALCGVGLAAQKLQQVLPLEPPSATQVARADHPPAPSPPGGVALTAQDLNTWLDGYLPYALRSADIPGAVVTVVKDGKILTARGYGYANVEKRTPVDPERTLFRPGSVSKLVTWTAVMQLVEQHKLDLDRDVNAYLDFRIPPRNGQPITLRQIMTHTAGFEEAVRGLIIEDPKQHVSLETYLKRWTPDRIFAPGTTPAYSNWATSLAGYIVQRVSGEDFDTYLDRHIFGPLGMHNSTFRQPLPANLAGQMATGYIGGKPKPFEFVEASPAGALSSSGTDMARFMIAHLQDGQLDGQRILQPATAQMMHNSPLGRVNPMSLLPPLNRMELGFFETNINGREVIGHLGDTSAFHTSLHLFMKENAGLYISFNSPGKAGAVQGLRTGVFEDFADRYFPNVAPPDGRVDARTAAEHARMMAGHWIVSRRIDSSFLAGLSWLAGQETVRAGPKGELIIPSLVGAGGRPREWVEIAPFVWRERDGHGHVAAKVVNGRPVRWSFDLAGPFEVYDRVPAGLDTGWILPALYLSLAVLLLTFLSWPIGWLVRRRYKAQSDFEGRALLVQRASRAAAGLSILLVLGWAIGISILLSSLTGAGGMDGFFWLLQILSLIVFVAAVPIGACNLWRTWRDRRRWTRKLWSLLVLLAALLLLYVAVRFNLLAMTVHY
jgi:CubicO group peptidase (beta-lactamase class C family)